jgi:BlaR1 peptidase M56
MLQYLIKFSVCLAVLYVFYKLVLRPLTFYQWNRFYLLCYSLVSFFIPFININPWVAKQVAKDNTFINIIPAIGNYSSAGDNLVTANIVANKPSWLQQFTLTDWIILLFCLGAVVMLVRLLSQYLSLRRIRKAAVLLNENAGIQLYETNAPVGPFSFGNAIYFNRQLHSDEELQRIIQHEFVHVKQKHTIDLMAGEFLCVINWFNPFAWFIRHAIRQNLEFIADNNVIENGLDKREYQYLLLKVLGIPQYSIASNFNFSNLKKRIAMMNKMKSARLHLTKFLFVLPLLAVLLLAFRNQSNNNIRKELLFKVAVTDTIPAPPHPVLPPAADYNEKGYRVTVADNTGETVVLVKDRTNKIIKAMTLEEWNNNKEKNETLYGKLRYAIVPDHPLYATVPDEPRVAIVTDEPRVATVTDEPRAAIVHALPPNVDNIKIYSNIDKKAGKRIHRATVTLKDGTKEIYNLDNKNEKQQYIKKYGDLPKPIAPIAPVPPAPAIDATPAVPPKTDANELAVPASPALPLKKINESPAGNNETDQLNHFAFKSPSLKLITNFGNSNYYSDTIPRAPINNKGYIITVADSNGQSVILIRDAKAKIVKAVSIMEWNKDETNYTEKYGNISSSLSYFKTKNFGYGNNFKNEYSARISGEREKFLQRNQNVKAIGWVLENKKDIQNPNLLIVLMLRNGKREEYNLDDIKQMQIFESKYGNAPIPINMAMSGNTFASQQTGSDARIKTFNLYADKEKVGANEKVTNINNRQIYPNDTTPVYLNKPMLIVGEPVFLDSDKRNPLPGLSGNTVYIGVTNKIRVYIKDILFKNIIIKTKDENAKVFKDDDGFVIKPIRKGNFVLKIYVKEETGLKEIGTKIYNADRLPDPNTISKRPEYLIIYADSITFKNGRLMIKGDMKFDGKESFAEGNIIMSFGGGVDEIGLIIYNGKEVTGIQSFTTVRAKYRVISLSAKEAIAKYGDKGKNGAVEIDYLGLIPEILVNGSAFNTSTIAKHNS